MPGTTTRRRAYVSLVFIIMIGGLAACGFQVDAPEWLVIAAMVLDVLAITGLALDHPARHDDEL